MKLTAVQVVRTLEYEYETNSKMQAHKKLMIRDGWDAKVSIFENGENKYKCTYEKTNERKS